MAIDGSWGLAQLPAAEIWGEGRGVAGLVVAIKRTSLNQQNIAGNKIVVASVPKRKLSDLKSELVSARSFPQTSNYHRNQITNGHN